MMSNVPTLYDNLMVIGHNPSQDIGKPSAHKIIVKNPPMFSDVLNLKDVVHQKHVLYRCAGGDQSTGKLNYQSHSDQISTLIEPPVKRTL